jgi:hypothetical protein
MAKAAEPCYFLFHGVKDDFCRGTTIPKCPDPQTSCPFYKSKLQYKMSLERARMNFKKRYGYDGYGTFRYTENYTEEALKGERVRTDDAGNRDSDTAFPDRPYL